jgi:uncharacterized protein (DUF1330 family)
MIHDVQINIPHHGRKVLLEGEHVMTIDGTPIMARRIVIEASADSFTQVTVTFDAKVQGTVKAKLINDGENF